MLRWSFYTAVRQDIAIYVRERALSTNRKSDISNVRNIYNNVHVECLKTKWRSNGFKSPIW